MTALFYIGIVLFLIICVMLSFVILIQESKSMGLGASFGGDPGESIFGTSTAQVLKKFTAYLAVIFMVACVLLSIWSGSIAKTPAAPAVQIEETNG
ncbi:MAG: preprotein translocase subunit SecG [Simkaniaceae bacterium]|nr:preprotein translocase subunit SecG [Candidatus Sacchlamyda saccharinae]